MNGNIEIKLSGIGACAGQNNELVAEMQRGGDRMPVITNTPHGFGFLFEMGC